MKFKKPRADEELIPYNEKMGKDGVEKYWLRENVLSLDGAPKGIVARLAEQGVLRHAPSRVVRGCFSCKKLEY